MLSSGMLHRVVLVRADVSEELSASIRVNGGDTISNFLQGPRGVTSQKTAFFVQPETVFGSISSMARCFRLVSVRLLHISVARTGRNSVTS
jgi:hypothetical protein